MDKDIYHQSTKFPRGEFEFPNTSMCEIESPNEGHRLRRRGTR